MKVACPTCKKEAEWTGNEFRPFCCERCKLLDLGAWAMEKFSVPVHDFDSSTQDKESGNQEPDGYEDD